MLKYLLCLNFVILYLSLCHLHSLRHAALSHIDVIDHAVCRRGAHYIDRVWVLIQGTRTRGWISTQADLTQNLCSSAFSSCHLSCQRLWRPAYLLLLFLKVLLPRNQQLVFIPYTCWNRKSLLKLKVVKINRKINVHIEGHRYCSEGSILVCCCTVHSKEVCFLYMEVTTIK